jgi:transposase
MPEICDRGNLAFDFISTGGIQRIIDRSSIAIKPIYNAVCNLARRQDVSGIDETSWFKCSKLQWPVIRPNRNKEAFLQIIADWKGILISDH